MLALATWRLSSLLAREDGPYQVFDWLRHKAGVRYDERSEPYAGNELARGLTCIWCNSVWIGALFTLAWIVSERISVVIALPLALSAGTIVIEAVIGATESSGQ